MSDTEPVPPARPLRHRETWTDCELLLQCVFNRMSVQEIAAELLRTQGAVCAQLARFVPHEAKIRRTDQRMEWLRRHLAENPEFDWQAVVNSHMSDPFRLWSGAQERLLKEGWDQRTALPDLVTLLQISEPTIAHHLIELGLAADIGEVVDRLGATVGGSVEARARLLRAELAEGIYVLIVERPRRAITSLHHSREEAERALREIVGDPSATETRWWVVRRAIDGRDAGPGWTGPSSR